jgi:protein SCO1/2
MLVFQRALSAHIQRLASTLAGKPIFWLAFIVTMFTWPILRSIRAERGMLHSRPVFGLVRDFTLRDQSGGELGATELRGRLWVASFTTAECEPTCIESRSALAKMAEVRHRTRNLGDAIRLVTFTVAPNRDAAAQLTELSAAYRASRGTWRFVSGPPARMEGVLRDFHISEGMPQRRLALVDGDMLIRGDYDLTDESALDALLRDVSLLLSIGR